MSTAVLRAPGVAVARDVTRDLCAALDLPILTEARPGADLHVRASAGLPFPAPGRLLRAADGWVHPGPPTAWETFTAMAISLGAAPPTTPGDLPDLRALSAEVVDAEAGDWRLPAVAVRPVAAAPAPVPQPADPRGTRRIGRRARDRMGGPARGPRARATGCARSCGSRTHTATIPSRYATRSRVIRRALHSTSTTRPIETRSSRSSSRPR